MTSGPFGACLQMEGWSDQEIMDKNWLEKDEEVVAPPGFDWNAWCHKNGTFVGLNARTRQMVGQIRSQ